MPFSILRSEIKQLVGAMRKLRLASSSLPILRHVRFEQRPDGSLWAEGTNLDETLRVRLGGSSSSSEELEIALVPFNELAALAKSGDKQDCLSIGSQDVTRVRLSDVVNGQTIARTVDVPDLSDWPSSIRADTVDLHELDLSRFLSAYRECKIAASNDSTRPILNGVYMDTQRKCLVATDGRRLAVREFPEMPPLNSLVIPLTQVLANSALPPGESVRMGCTLEADKALQLWFAADSWEYGCRVVDGVYPNYQQVIPDPDASLFKIDLASDDVHAVACWHRQFPCKDSNAVFLYADSRQVLLLSHDDSDELTPLALPNSRCCSERPLVLAFERQYLVDALGVGALVLRAGGEESPVRFEQAGSLRVLMPQRAYNRDKVLEFVPHQPPTAITRQEPETEEDVTMNQAEANPTPVPPEPETTNAQSAAADQPILRLPVDPVDEILQQIDAAQDQLRDAANTIRSMKNGLREIRRLQKTREREFKSATDLIDRLKKIAA